MTPCTRIRRNELVTGKGICLGRFPGGWVQWAKESVPRDKSLSRQAWGGAGEIRFPGGWVQWKAAVTGRRDCSRLGVGGVQCSRGVGG